MKTKRTNKMSVALIKEGEMENQMKTKRTNKMSVAVLVGVVALVASASTSQAAWSTVLYTYNPDTGVPRTAGNVPYVVNDAANTDGYAYNQTIPGNTLSVTHELRLHFAWANSDTINAWSANSISFNTFNTTPANAVVSSQLIFKFDFDKAVTSADWTAPYLYRLVSGGATLKARYSLDGIVYSDAFNYGSGDGEVGPGAVALNIATPTNVLYLGLFADVPSGNGYFSTGNTGQLAVTVPEPMSMALLGLGSLVCLRRRNRN